MNRKTEDELAYEHMHDREEKDEVISEKRGGMNSVKIYLEDIWTEINILKEKVRRLENKS
jgi:hypothetical protein